MSDNGFSIRHDKTNQCFSAGTEERMAHLDYLIEGGRMVCTHTFVPPELRGRGLAEQLVRAALAEARTKGWRVVPACSYVAAFIERHPEYRDLLAEGV